MSVRTLRRTHVRKEADMRSALGLGAVLLIGSGSPMAPLPPPKQRNLLARKTDDHRLRARVPNAAPHVHEDADGLGTIRPQRSALLSGPHSGTMDASRLDLAPATSSGCGAEGPSVSLLVARISAPRLTTMFAATTGCGIRTTSYSTRIPIMMVTTLPTASGWEPTFMCCIWGMGEAL
jgi:hypothetical protein